MSQRDILMIDTFILTTYHQPLNLNLNLSLYLNLNLNLNLYNGR
jgi:hypothetical protein